MFIQTIFFQATFHTPFSQLGQSPEGCSSYIFPKIMGNAKAGELLLFNKKITAQEAFERNLVTQVFPENVFHKETEALVSYYASLPPQVTRTACQSACRLSLSVCLPFVSVCLPTIPLCLPACPLSLSVCLPFVSVCLPALCLCLPACRP